MEILKLDQIKERIKNIDLLPSIEKGLAAYSEGQAVVPPVGELLFQNPPGDVHIKYGYLIGDEYYAVKIASGFYDNYKLNLSSLNGLIVLFSQKTGEIFTVLLDEGYLTNLRTGIAGAIAAKYLAPRNINQIGIIGTGTQAKIQLYCLKKIVKCKDVVVFGRNDKNLAEFKTEMEQADFRILTTKSVNDITAYCNLIVTTTPAAKPFLFADQIRKGVHITAVGADTPAKQEVDAAIFGMADLVVADSIAQCIERGDLAYAIRNNIIAQDKIIELGNIISGKVKGRTDENQITIADLTGLAVQDIQIAKAVFEAGKA